MNIDFVNQIRQEEQIGGGGSAATYRGVILDSKLIEVYIFCYIEITFKINIFCKKKKKKKKKKKFKFKEVAIKQIFENQNISSDESRLRFEQEISIIWGISSHPNIVTLVGYSENPSCIITKVFFFSFIILFDVYIY